jgi:hypothetical protein
MRDYRCERCGEWLFATGATDGEVRITCLRRKHGRTCRTTQTIRLVQAGGILKPTENVGSSLPPIPGHRGAGAFSLSGKRA